MATIPSPFPKLHPLGQISFVALDTETTGLSWRRCQLLEVAAVRFDVAGNVVGSFAQLIDPGCYIPREATAVHGITNAMVAGKPRVDEVIPAFFDFLEEQPSVILIHNAGFDLGFLCEAARRAGRRCPMHPVVDTLPLARRRLTELHSHRLDLLVRHFGEADAAEHRALGDAEMLRRIFLRMVDRDPVIEHVDHLLQYVKLKPFDSPAVRQPRSSPAAWQ